jgi:hypothetical protein
MNRKLIHTVILGALLPILSLPAVAVQAPSDRQSQLRSQDTYDVSGNPILTPQERDQYRAKLQAAKTPEERAQIRKERHDLLAERGKGHVPTAPENMNF